MPGNLSLIGLLRLTILAILLTPLTLPAGAPSTLAAPAAKRATIRFETWSLNKSDASAWTSLIQTFEKKRRKVKVAIATTPAASFETHLQAEFLAGSAPDVFLMDGGWAQDFMRGGVVQPLGKLVARDKSFHATGFTSRLAGSFSFNRHVYAYPMYYSTLALFRNKAVFKAHKIKHAPTDWRSFSRVACEVTKKKRHLFGAALAPDPAHWLAFVHAFGGRILNRRGKKVELNSPETVSALRWYARLVRKRCAEAPSNGSGAQEFGKKHTAMTFELNWMMPYMRQHYPKIKWAVSPLPTGPGGNANFGFPVGIAINAHTKSKRVAWELVKYLLSRGAMAQWVKASDDLPGRRSVVLAHGTRAFIRGASYADPWVWPAGVDANAFPHLTRDMQKVDRGQQHYKSAVADMASWIARYLPS